MIWSILTWSRLRFVFKRSRAWVARRTCVLVITVVVIVVFHVIRIFDFSSFEDVSRGRNEEKRVFGKSVCETCPFQNREGWVWRRDWVLGHRRTTKTWRHGVISRRPLRSCFRRLLHWVLWLKFRDSHFSQQLIALANRCECRSQSISQLLNNDIAVSKKFDIEVHVIQRLSIDQNLRYFGMNRRWNESDRSYFQRRTHDEEKITPIFVHSHCLVKLVRQSFSKEYNVRLHDCHFKGIRTTLRTERYPLLEDVFSDVLSLDLKLTSSTGCSCKRSMTVDNLVYACRLFKSVNVLSVVSQELAMAFQEFDELVWRRRFKLPRIDFLRKLKKGSRVSPEVMDVEHGLRIRKSRKLFTQSRVYAITRPEVRDSTWNWYSCSSQDDDLLTSRDEVDDIRERRNIRKSLSHRRLRHERHEEPEECHSIAVGRDSLVGKKLLQ